MYTNFLYDQKFTYLPKYLVTLGTLVLIHIKNVKINVEVIMLGV